MRSTNEDLVAAKLDTLIELSRNMLALELWKGGATQEGIAKRLHVSKSTVVEMLRGVEKAK
jgi:Mn-dependent DtxR family transcriptional regulator